jgi:hypothetical protein
MKRAELESILEAHGFNLAELVGAGVRPDLDKLAAKWIERLRLGAWQIAISYVPNLTMNGAPVHGLCDPFVERRRATIEINDPSTAHDDDGGPPTVEEVLLHELLHVAAAELARTGGVVAEEQLVDVLTSNLLNGERETVLRAMAVRSPKIRKASVIMNSSNNITARLEALEAAIETINTRLDAIEGGPSPSAKKAPPRASSVAPRRDRSSPEVVARLNERMGFASSPARVERRGRDLVLRTLTAEQARRATKGAA